MELSWYNLLSLHQSLCFSFTQTLIFSFPQLPPILLKYPLYLLLRTYSMSLSRPLRTKRRIDLSNYSLQLQQIVDLILLFPTRRTLSLNPTTIYMTLQYYHVRLSAMDFLLPYLLACPAKLFSMITKKID